MYLRCFSTGFLTAYSQEKMCIYVDVLVHKEKVIMGKKIKGKNFKGAILKITYNSSYVIVKFDVYIFEHGVLYYIPV